MTPFMKNLIKTSCVLMLISGFSALLVGATNAITAPIIEENNVKKEESTLSVVYGDKVNTFVQWKEYEASANHQKENDNYTYLSTLTLNYVSKIWTAKYDATEVGYIARFSGKNGYGAVDMLVGISLDFKLGGLFTISDSMSYKNKLEPGYIDPYNESNDKEAAVNDVKCGATYAANILKAGITEARDVIKATIERSQK